MQDLPPPPLPPPPDIFWLIQPMKLLTRANTVKKLVRHIPLPQLTAPRRTHLPPSLQTNGPPLSPWQPPAWPATPLPAQTMDDSSTGIKRPFILEQRKCSTTGSIACWSTLAAAPPPTVLPHPVTIKHHFKENYLLDVRSPKSGTPHHPIKKKKKPSSLSRIVVCPSYFRADFDYSLSFFWFVCFERIFGSLHLGAPLLG